jgi:hypothetical protein
MPCEIRSPKPRYRYMAAIFVPPLPLKILTCVLIALITHSAGADVSFRKIID